MGMEVYMGVVGWPGQAFRLATRNVIANSIPGLKCI